MKGSILAGIALIVVGVVLLLRELDLLIPTRGFILSGISLGFGIFFAQKLFNNQERKGLWGAVFFTLTAVQFLLMELRLLPLDDLLAFGFIMLNIGIANMLLFIFTRKKIFHMVWGLIFILIAAPFIADFFRILPGMFIADIITTYWPSLLLIIGLGVIADGYFSHKKNK
jgi:predicted nucleic acid-binding Zn ribbon protein